MRAILTARELMVDEAVVAAEIQRPLSSRLPSPTKNAVTRLGGLVVCGRDAQDAQERTHQAVRPYRGHLAVELAPASAEGPARQLWSEDRVVGFSMREPGRR